MPVGNALVKVGGQFEVIRPGFSANTVATVFSGDVVVIETVHTKHPVTREAAHSKADIGGRAFIIRIPADPTLGKNQVIRGIKHRE